MGEHRTRAGAENERKPGSADLGPAGKSGVAEQGGA